LNRLTQKWLKPSATLLVMFLLVWFLPAAPMDPWNLLSPRKVATMIFALAIIQVMGSVTAQVLGVRAGAMVTGFLGGLISSTATTATLAKRSKTAAPQEVSTEVLTFLSATAAMLFEGIALLLTGTTGFHFTLILIFLGPILMTALMIYRHSRNLENQGAKLQTSEFQVLPLLKLAAFIIAILVLSKVLQNVLGQKGLMILTFLVSLFEIHGSVIANIQLHDSGVIDVALLGGLLTLSIVASYLSKLFMIYTLGSSALRVQVTQSTGFLFFSLLVSWLIFALTNLVPLI